MRQRRYARVAAAALLLALTSAAGAAAQSGADGDSDGGAAEFTIEDPRIVESSGLQASHQHPGVYWTHNDSDYPPEIYAVDSATGQTVATVTLEGVEFRDVEAIHLGPEGHLYVGDIGDNLDGGWPHVWIYQFPEPAELADTALTPTVHTVTYDDGPRDAEALMVHPDTGRVYLASKKRDGSGAIYAGPEQLSAEAPNVFERMYDTDLWVTDGAFSPDGTRLLLRGYFGAEIFAWADGTPDPIGLVTVPLQPQGESVTFTPDGRTAMFGSEGERSEVIPVELTGDQRPENVRRADEADNPPEPGTGDERADEEDGNGRLVLFALAATVLVVALRRIFRGSGRRRAD